MILLGLDSTFFDTYGNQENKEFKFHYQSYGYHSLVYYDGSARYINGNLSRNNRFKMNLENDKKQILGLQGKSTLF